MPEPEPCTRCKKRPQRPKCSLGEMLANQHYCDECYVAWKEEIARSRPAVEQKAQAQLDKMMRDTKDGMDPREAWDRKDETDG